MAKLPSRLHELYPLDLPLKEIPQDGEEDFDVLNLDNVGGEIKLNFYSPH